MEQHESSRGIGSLGDGGMGWGGGGVGEGDGGNINEFTINWVVQIGPNGPVSLHRLILLCLLTLIVLNLCTQFCTIPCCITSLLAPPIPPPHPPELFFLFFPFPL